MGADVLECGSQIPQHGLDELIFRVLLTHGLQPDKGAVVTARRIIDVP